MRYAFVGGTYRGLKVFERLIAAGHKPSMALILKEDDHESLRYSDKLIDLSERHEIPNSCKKKIAENDYALLQTMGLDFLIVCGWRTLIDTKLNKYLKLGMVAAHDSLLPRYRGFAPLNWAMINGEKETGVTLFLIAEGDVDSGGVISQKRVPIRSNEYAIDVHEKVTRATVDLYVEFIKAYKKGKIKLVRQNERLATYTCKRTPADGKIDWRKGSAAVLNLIRALAHPYPGAYCEYDGKTFHIRKAVSGASDQRRYVGRIQGRVIKIDGIGIEVLCGKGSIKILEWECKSDGLVESPAVAVKSITATLT